MTTPFAPEQTPAAGAEPQAQGTPMGAQPAAEPQQAQQQQAPAGADPRVLEQMQQQLQQFGEYLPALQTLAQSQGAVAPQEPSLEDQFAQFFPQGDPNDPYAGYDPNAGYGDPGLPPGAQFDPYTGQPVQQQQAPRFDPYTGQPLQPQGQQQGGLNGNPQDLVGLFREVVRQETAPLQQQESQRQWDALYQEIPQMQDPEHAPQIADHVARAAYLFANGDEGEARRLAGDPRFARFAYFANVNEQAGRGESPAGANDGITPIEAGSSTSAPGGAEVSAAQGIVNAGQQSGGGAGAHFR